jgi:DNA-binding HxlR family transcriptional regulator
MKPSDKGSGDMCPIYCIIEKLSTKWSMLILRSMMEHKKMRFSEILEVLPEINSRILSDRLSRLEKEGLITRTVEKTKPIRIYYEITEKSVDLRKVFACFISWGKKWGHQEKKKTRK